MEYYPERSLITGLFEIGTMGEGMDDQLNVMKAVINENQLYWYGAEKEKDAQRIFDSFRDLYYPKEKEWKESAIIRLREGFENLLSKENLLKGTSTRSSSL
nr:DUF2817 domain-containing protein [Alteribacter salitolerans]